MFVEIERKYLFKGTPFDFIRDVSSKAVKEERIYDYYLNEFTRVRAVYDEENNVKWYMCTKSKGNLVRDEYEFELKGDEVTHGLMGKVKYLCKYRYYVEYKGFKYEVNVFKNFPFILVELNLPSKDAIVDKDSLPLWLGEEVTEDEKYYGYNLWKEVEDKSTGEVECNKCDNEVLLDKLPVNEVKVEAKNIDDIWTWYK